MIKIDVDIGTLHNLNTGKDGLEGMLALSLLILFIYLKFSTSSFSCSLIWFFSDILILHLENGKDYFITVGGKFLVSSFGNTLEFLTRTPQPVRTTSPLFPNPSLSPATRGTPAQPATDVSAEQRLSIPKELWRLVDYLYKKGMQEVCFT